MFAGIVVLKRAFSPSSSFLRSENRTIFSRDIAKNMKAQGVREGGVCWGLGGGRLLEGEFVGGFTVVTTLTTLIQISKNSFIDVLTFKMLC